MTSSSTRSSARAESGKSESRPGVSPRESISEKKATALNAVAFFVDLPPLLQRRIESAAERCCGRDRRPPAAFYLGLCRLRGTLPLPAPHDCAAGGLFLAAAAVRVMAFCRRNGSSLPQRRLDSDAERCCGRDRCHTGGFLLRIMPPSWHPVPACTPRLRCRRTILSCSSDKNRRRNYSSLPRRKLESDADLVAATVTAGETVLLCGNEE